MTHAARYLVQLLGAGAVGLGMLVAGLLTSSSTVSAITVGWPIRLFASIVPDRITTSWDPDLGNTVLFVVVIATWTVLMFLLIEAWLWFRLRRTVA